MAATAWGLRPPPLGGCCRSWRRVGGHARGRGTDSPGASLRRSALPGHSMPLGEGWTPSGMTLVGPGVGARSARGRARTPVPRRDTFYSPARTGARTRCHGRGQDMSATRRRQGDGAAGWARQPIERRERDGGQAACPAGTLRPARLPAITTSRRPAPGSKPAHRFRDRQPSAVLSLIRAGRVEP